MSARWCSAGIRLAVQITPNAKKREVIGVLDNVLKIRLQAQPIEGKAMHWFAADTLQCPKSTVRITHGQTNKRKLLEISAHDLTVEAVTQVRLPASVASYQEAA